MKFKKFAAASLIASAAVLGATGTAAADPFDGHFEGCSGQHDGSQCYLLDGGVYQHLDMR